MKVLVVGGSGMLGTTLVAVLAERPELEVYATYRNPWGVGPPEPDAGAKKWFMFVAGQQFPPAFGLEPGDWIVNCAGAIPQRLAGSEARMVRVNALLPYELAEMAEEADARLINVTTDCVFSGGPRAIGSSLNKYKEQDAHDARSLYGRSKSMGEVRGNVRVLNLRCSIVGPEPRGRSDSLLGWFLSCQEGSVTGYGDHFWNGVTTLALSKVIRGIVLGKDLQLSDLQHLIPADWVSKASLLGQFARHFDKAIEVAEKKVGGVDRTLGTSRPEMNKHLWELAGYGKPPRIEEMVQELASWVAAGGYPFMKEVVQ